MFSTDLSLAWFYLRESNSFQMGLCEVITIQSLFTKINGAQSKPCSCPTVAFPHKDQFNSDSDTLHLIIK